MDKKQYEILALLLRYWFALLILCILYILLKKVIMYRQGSLAKRTTGNIPFILALFALSAFGLLAGRDPGGYDYEVFLLGVIVSLVVMFQFYFLFYFFKGIDEVLLSIVDFLAVLGLVMLQRLSPELAMNQVEWFIYGNVGMFIFIIIFSRNIDLGRLTYPLMISGLAILVVVLLFGRESGGAKRYIVLGPFSVQPSELVKLIFIFVLAHYLKVKRTFVKNLPLYLFAALSVVLVVLHKDLGSALQYFLLFVFVYYIATSDWLITGAAVAAGILGAVISFKLFPHVRVRVQAWKNPWADIEGGGYQVAQALIAIGSGGLLGFGLGLGEPDAVPASRTDFIFAAICEEFGILAGAAVIILFGLLLVRGMQKGFESDKESDMLLVCGSVISLTIQAFIIIGGVIKLIPLTGITLPFVSYGGSSMFVSLCLAGIIQGISIKNYRLARAYESSDTPDEIEYEGEGIDEQD